MAWFISLFWHQVLKQRWALQLRKQCHSLQPSSGTFSILLDWHDRDMTQLRKRLQIHVFRGHTPGFQVQHTVLPSPTILPNLTHLLFKLQFQSRLWFSTSGQLMNLVLLVLIFQLGFANHSPWVIQKCKAGPYPWKTFNLVEGMWLITRKQAEIICLLTLAWFCQEELAFKEGRGHSEKTINVIKIILFLFFNLSCRKLRTRFEVQLFQL